MKPAMNDAIQLWHDQHVCGGMDVLRAHCLDYRYPPHTHDCFVVAAFKAGAQKHRIARHHGIAYPGTVMIIPPGEVHTGESMQRDQGWTYSAFYPSQDNLERISAELLWQERGSLDFGRSLLVEDKELADRLLRASDVAYMVQDALRRQEVVYEAMSLLIKRYGHRKSGNTRPPLQASISRGLEFMNDCFKHPLRIEDISTVAGLSEFHFMRLFKSRMNMTVHQYLNNVRLESAKTMLAHGVPATAVATNVGFYDQSHFTKNFRRAFGITPNSYANACR